MGKVKLKCVGGTIFFNIFIYLGFYFIIIIIIFIFLGFKRGGHRPDVPPSKSATVGVFEHPPPPLRYTYVFISYPGSQHRAHTSLSVYSSTIMREFAPLAR